ncbi:MAG: hypothetical protein AAF591_09470 [Verrucomicrobiota bacterium]
MKGIVCSLAAAIVSCGGGALDENPEVRVEARLLATSGMPTLEEIAPYDEALVHHEYEVERVLDGEGEPGRARVARWGVLASKEQEGPGEIGSVGTMTLVPLDGVPGLDTVRVRDDLPFEPDLPVYLDLSQSLAAADAPAQVRYDYRSDFSKRMRTYWLARDQIRLVVTGNSHTGTGVAAREFFLPENETTPVAVNMSPAGSGMDLQCLLVREYLMALPRLEWIVWGVSPRIFNGRTVPCRRHEMFIESPGYRFDREHWEELVGIEDGATEAVTVGDIREATGKGFKYWGWSPARHRDYPEVLDATSEKDILRQCRMDRFIRSEDLWAQFEETVALVTGKGVRLLLFTPPYHPLTARGVSVDVDGTGREAYEEIVERLEAMARENSLVLFEDIHNGGEHDFPHEEFANADHLAEAGAMRLTARLVEIVESHTEVD